MVLNNKGLKQHKQIILYYILFLRRNHYSINI